jgi:hypothetical protein
MTWVLLLLAAWLAVSLPFALLVARAIRRADQEVTDDWTGLHFVLRDDETAIPVPRAGVRRRVDRR